MIKVFGKFILALCTIILLLPIEVQGQSNFKNSAVPILLYHHIAEENPEGNEYIISPDNFYKHMLFLKNNGYECITLDDYYNYRQGIKALPEKPVIITFDDGYYSNYEYAYPILKGLNMKAVVFIATAFAEDDSQAEFAHFNWEQAQEMQDSDIIDIQSHSHSHKNLLHLSEAEVLQELELSKKLIEVNLDKECNYFAYPNGAYNFEIQSMAEEAGYLMQFTTRMGRNTDAQPLSELKRITILNSTTSEEFAEVLLPFKLEFNNIEKYTSKNQQMIAVGFDVINNMGDYFDSLVVLAIYDSDNKLIHMSSCDIALKNYRNSGIFFDVKISDNSHTIKLFCVDSFENMSPYAPVISYVL